MGIFKEQVPTEMLGVYDEYMRLPREGAQVGQVEITDVDVARFFLQSLIVKDLERRYEGKLLISQDIGVAEDTLLQPGLTHRIPILLPKDLEDLHPALLSVLHRSTRSRYAQAGIEVLPGTGYEIAHTIEEVEIEGNIRKIAYVHVRNHATRPIELPKGTEFFYMYYWNGRFLQGDDLTSRIDRDMFITGKEGENWAWWYEELPGGELGEVWGIELYLDPMSFKTISAQAGNAEAIRISDKSTPNHNRQGVDLYLEPVSRPEGQLYIGETKAHVIIGPNLHGIIDQTLGTYEGQIIPAEPFYQTNSVVLQGGNTDSHIRVEVLCSDKWFPSSVFVRFARAHAQA